MYRNLLRTSQVLSFLLAAIATVITVSSCGNSVGQAKQGSVTGVVFKGLVSEAEVKAFSMDGARRGDELGTATTAEDGTFTVNVKSHAGPVMVCATRGTYVEEATGGLVQLGVNELCSLIENHGAGDTSTTLLTPLTTFHTSLTGCFFDAGRDATLSAASQHSALRLNDFFAAGQAGFDVRTTIPLDPTTGLAASLTAEAWAGILVAGLSESAKGYAVASGLDPGVRVTAATLTAALSQDIDDGACIFDGQTATARLVQGTVDLNEGALRGSPQGLATSILRFLESERNTSGIAQENVRDLVQRMQSHASEIFGGGGGGGADIDDPEVAFLAPTGAEPISVSGNIRIEVTAEDASSIDEFVFEAPARITGATKDCFPPDEVNATFRCSLVGELNTTLEPEGELLVTARARDASGNQTTTNLRLAINSARPVITFASPTVGAEVQETFEVRVTAADVDGIRSVTVTGATLNNTSPRTDEFTAAWDTTGEPEGPLTLTATATDERGLTAELSIDVVVDNLEDGRLTGAVDIGAPVAGSTVQAFALTANGRGAAVSAESITEEAGTYELLVPSYRGPILVVAREGVFNDVATGQPQTFGGTHELTAALPDFGPGLTATLNLNALTTLAAAHAVASAFSEAELAAAIETSTTRLGLHARRNGPERDALPVNTVVSASFSEPLISTADTTVMALFHAGLSRLALDATDDLILAPGDIGSLDLIEALVDDLANVRFDGRNLAGQETFYDPSRTRSTSAYTVRFDLVSALHNFILNAPLERSRVVFPQNASGITTVQLSVPGGFYDDLAKNDDPRLFSAENPVIPFDVEPPTISTDFTTHDGATDGSAVLSGPVRLLALASEESTGRSGISSFRITSPASLVGRDDDPSLVERIDITLNPSSPTDFDSDFQCEGAAPNQLSDASRGFCVCLEAIDGVQNISRQAVCFARPIPTIRFNRPADGASFNSNQSIDIEVLVDGGFSMSGCRLVVGAQTFVQQAHPTDPNGCLVTGTVTPQSLGNGRHQFSFSSFEVLPLEVTNTVTVDLDAGSARLTSPVPNGFQQTNRYVLRAEASEPLRSLTIKLRRDSPTGNVIFSQVFDPAGTGLTFEASAFTDNDSSGQRFVTFTAVDLAGNSDVSSQSFIYDVSRPGPPLITGLSFLREDPAVPVSPTPGFCLAGFQNCTVSSLPTVPNPGALPAASRALAAGDIFTTSGIPGTVIQRWQNRVDISTHAPEVTLSANDDAGGAGISHFVWGVARANADNSCPTFTLSKRTDLGTSIRLTPTTTGFNLGGEVTNGGRLLCLTAQAVDRAGNASSPGSLFFRWQTIQPPLNYSAIQTTPLSDAVDVATRDDSTGAFFDFLTGPQAGTYRVAHMFVRNPYSFPVTFTAPPLPVTASLDASSQRRYDATKATLWIVDSLRNPSRGESGTAFTATMRPDWSNATNNRTGLTVYTLSNPCGGSSCVNTVVSSFDMAFPGVTNPADATFGSTFRNAFPDSLYSKSIVPTCFLAQEPSGLPTATSCTPVNVAQGIFTLAAGQFVVLSYQTSHTTTDKEFLAPGWSSTINDKVPVFADKIALPNNDNWDAEHPTFVDNTFLLHRSGTTTLTQTLLMVSADSTPDLVCRFAQGCHWGRFQVIINGARLGASSTTPLVPVTGNGTTAQSWTASTIAVPSTFRTLTAPAP